jgi:hypothetical protein
MITKKAGCARAFVYGLLIFSVLCLGLVGVSFLSNQLQPSHSQVVDRLNDVEKARLAEAFHLRQVLGDQVLPGWAEVDVPLVVYNEAYLFLVGLPDPTPGWQAVPQGSQIGGAWEPVPGDDFQGQPYYRQSIPASGQTTQAFTVRIGDHWAASLTTFEWTRISMTAQLRQELPGPLQPVVPVSWFVKMLVPGSDTYVTLALHEALHAYQGVRAAEKLSAAERNFNTNHQQYPYTDEAFQAAWQQELDLLYQAVRASDPAETQRLANAFLDQRARRREAQRLSDTMIAMEREKEWEEGVAKYGELSIYRLAASSSQYQPLPEISQDAEFHQYRGAQQKWDQEIAQIRRVASADSDGRFYYSGFAQAVLLDRLMPGWKERLFDSDVWLETLLEETRS